ncbi:pantoate--beta-alanine ligase [Marinicella litoralis]|uniref:Pantothenate synthetase n=1 Tax=Marinicella litoralis TaxID=644220 RepID=A0A4R6XMM8_9GAMM|nr:pantoate--beta-alanine ligase [Marinicella litoralis]TDR20856.1 pantothenate synthetase [Marinicella litoralis]
MLRIDSIDAWQAYRKNVDGDIGLVPTMGALHAGHLSLVNAAKSSNEHVVVSIFVNPTQFNQANDFEKYPNTLDEDLSQLAQSGVDAVFMPTFELMYPDNYIYQLTEKDLSTQFCGAHRPGHFDGVLTVVMKLLNLVQPNQAFFGEKDFQQLALIKGMVKAFFINTQIVSCPIVREADGLAMSSRNLRLSAIERKVAPQLYATLNSDSTLKEKTEHLNTIGFDVDYLAVMGDRLLVAATLGEIRLIDNVPYDMPGDKA